MENWHSMQLDKLNKLIQEEFLGLYKKYNKENNIYGVVLVLDDDGLSVTWPYPQRKVLKKSIRE
ncbi:DUF4303 domain-containing protein [Cronobacter sakazakii]|nr:DUF4303 domain-containing protein [Cronobacter sakazakii]